MQNEKVTLEHINVTVSDPLATGDRLGRLFGWHIRWKGAAKLGGTTVHVGTDDQYLAVYSHDADAEPARQRLRPGELNHVGVLVDDLDAVEAKVVAEGFETYSHGDYEPGRRFYFRDGDGIEFEVVSYA